MKKRLLLAVIYWAVVTLGIVYAFGRSDDAFTLFDIVASFDTLFIFAASFVLLAIAGSLRDFLKGIPAAFIPNSVSSGNSYKAWKTFYIAITVMAVLNSIIYFFITSYNLRWAGIAVVYKKAELPLNDIILNEISNVLLNGLSSLYLVFLVIVYTLPIACNLNRQ
jgi:hypothetical protein